MTETHTLAWRRSGRDLDVGDRHEADARVIDLAADDVADLLAQQLIERAVRWSSPAHDASSSAARLRRLLRHGYAYAATRDTVCWREALDDVAFLDLVELVEADAALVARGDLADVVAEAAQRLDPVGRDELAAAVDARAAADDAALGDVAAGR